MTKKNIILTALKNINSTTLESIKIFATIGDTEEKAGAFEYFSAEAIPKDIDIIVTKFSDEDDFPKYHETGYISLQDFLNEQSMNQLFLNFNVNQNEFESKYSKEEIEDMGKTEILLLLTEEYFGTKYPEEYGADKDFFFITNLEKEKGVGTNKYTGAFHRISNYGGVHMDNTKTYSGDFFRSTSHELGHFIGLPHTFKDNPNAKVHKIVNPTEGYTGNNYMDYFIQRNNWFKFQLLNYIRINNEN